MHTTRAQRLAMFNLFKWIQFPGGYKAFRKTCRNMFFSGKSDGTYTIMVHHAGMLLGIEPDGYTHS